MRSTARDRLAAPAPLVPIALLLAFVLGQGCNSTGEKEPRKRGEPEPTALLPGT